MPLDHIPDDGGETPDAQVIAEIFPIAPADIQERIDVADPADPDLVPLGHMPLVEAESGTISADVTRTDTPLPDHAKNVSANPLVAAILFRAGRELGLKQHVSVEAIMAYLAVAFKTTIQS